MADIRCPSCGKNNPDFLDVCQFCQTPLKPESMVHTGENPVKKNTGELEPILPQWLRDVRQQARASAEENAAEEAAKPKVQKEPPDLLAGLVSQTREDEDEIPDWLASINPSTKPRSIEAPPPEPKPEKDFFAKFDISKPGQTAPQVDEPIQEDVPSWMAGAADSMQVHEEKDELSAWLAQASAESDKPIELEFDGASQMAGVDQPSFTIKQPETPKAEEDLGWLHALEDSSKGPAQPSAPQPDLNWAPGAEPSQPSAGQEDLNWLNTLGVASEPAAQESTPVQSVPQTDSPDWLTNLDVGHGMEAPSAPVAPFVPRRTAPLDEKSSADSMPDWLKSATEEPSMPAPGALSDWFREADKPPRFDQAQRELSTPQSFDLTQGKPVPLEQGDAPAPAESASLSNQDIDSLFSVTMPDWLSHPEPGAEGAPPSKVEAPGDEAITPVDLPAWVQAMRPVESVISETASVENQPTEREGPLAGLRGVIPIAPIGSSRRPKAFSLKLQASDEQQSAAGILEKILAGEMNPRPLATPAFVTSQRALRWALSGLFILVLGAMIFLQTQSMPISAALPVEVSNISQAIVSLPPNSSVLVVVDYEPALAGEMEAVTGPLLDQLVLLGRPRLTFLATSPNSSALVDRLLANTKISLPAPNGLDYKAGENYFNLGYLPGGSSGVLEFVESPASAIPSAGVHNLSEYAAVILLTDHAESGRNWVEQLDARKRIDPSLANQPLLVAASAQAGPLLQPYVSSRQVTGMVSGLSDAARYEFVNNSRPGIARAYWDSFGVGLLMAIALIAAGSMWSLITGIRARRAEAGAG